MASTLTNSIWLGKGLGDVLTGTIAGDLDSAVSHGIQFDLYKFAGFDNSDTLMGSGRATETGTPGTSSVFTSGQQVVSSGSYTSGGSDLQGTAQISNAAAGGTGKMIFKSSATTAAFTGATWTDAGYLLMLFGSLTPKRGFAVLPFGAAIPVTAGTFTITWDATNGYAYIAY